MQYRQFQQLARDQQLSRNGSKQFLPEINFRNNGSTIQDGSNTVRGADDTKEIGFPSCRKSALKGIHTVRFEDTEAPKGIIKNDSILKRKSSNSREHTDIDSFFELAEKSSTRFLRKHNKHVSLQPLHLEKKVSFNQEIEVKLIEDIDKKYTRPNRRHFTVNDLK